MDPLKVAAQFAAYVWYCDRHPDADDSGAEAVRFARENWVGFLPQAQERLGELLVQLAAHRNAAVQRYEGRLAAGFPNACP